MRIVGLLLMWGCRSYVGVFGTSSGQLDRWTACSERDFTRQTEGVPRLLIVRHAKAATAVRGANDHSRPLAPAGVAQLPHLAAAVVAALAALAAPMPGSPDSARRDSARLDPARLDLVLCSPSARTRETVAGLMQAQPQLGAARVKVKRALYLADVDDLLTVLRHLPDDVETALVCGHNPGLHGLALTLLGSAADAQLRQGLPTAGLVVVNLDRSWASIGAQQGAS